MNNLEMFTGLYQKSKTLRFELIPVGKTMENIEKNGILEKDAALAESYKRMKKTIDCFHKEFIDKRLALLSDNKTFETSLQKYFDLEAASPEQKKEDSYSQALKATMKDLRKCIADSFGSEKKTQSKDFKILFDKELIQKVLPAWALENKQYYDNAFKSFTTYFFGYHENRKNMYTSEEKATAVSYRLINENLPRFLNNARIFLKLEQVGFSEQFAAVMRDMEPWINYNSLQDMFAPNAYVNTLNQSQIEAYNTVIGGRLAGGKKYQGLNEYINLYNQTHPDAKLPRLKQLYKQILSDRESASWLPAEFDNAEEAIKAVYTFYDSLFCLQGAQEKTIVEMLQDCLAELPDTDLGGIYINGKSLSLTSQAVFGKYSFLRDAMERWYLTKISPNYEERYKKAKNDASRDKIEKEKDKFTSGTVSLAVLCDAVKEYAAALDGEEYLEAKTRAENGALLNHFSDIRKELCAIDAAKDAAEYLFSALDSDIRQTDTDKIKALLDALMKLLHKIKPLYTEDNSAIQKDDYFYGAFDRVYESFAELPKLYDKVRNYFTKKAFKTEKIKLFFENKGNFLGGWVESKTDNSDNGTQAGGYLFRKKNGIGEYDYYLGISSDAKLFRFSNEVAQDDRSDFERLNYYQPKDQTVYGAGYKGNRTYAEDKQILKEAILYEVRALDAQEAVAALDAYYDNNQSSPSGALAILHDGFPMIYQNVICGKEFQKQNQALIDALKLTLSKYYRLPGAAEAAQKDYTLFTEIMDVITTLCANKVYSYCAVSAKEMDEVLNREGKGLYLFKISNKDLSYAETYLAGKRKSRGKENLHTMFFKALMSGSQSVYDLGSAEVFYRKHSIEYKEPTHRAGTPLSAKNPNRHGASVFGYDLYKDRRYSVDKFQLHFSVIANYSCASKYHEMQKKTADYLRNNPNVNIIGIDRGERHLLYLSMIDRNGNVVRDENGKLIQYSLNTITGSYRDKDGNEVEFETPYRDLLDKKEEARKQAREAWGTIESIKELKSGYLSQVIHHISKLMVKYNAVVVLEDLNSGFKNGRKRVEKQVYQNFEKALIEKLNYLVLKDAEEDAPGGLYHALQLTEPFKSFREMSQQNGFLLYVPAWNTSKIDPVTGFVDLLKPRYRNIPEAKEFFRRFTGIVYDAGEDAFRFVFDYEKFTEKAEGTRTVWTISTQGKLRYSFSKTANNGKGAEIRVDVTDNLKRLFSAYQIAFEDGEDLRNAICSQDSAEFFAKLIKALQTVLAMRYSSAEDGKDFILSPVADENGKYFCSESADCNTLGLPGDADANGAYNIARKGLLVLRKLDLTGRINTHLTNREWLAFAQSGAVDE